MKSAAGFVIFRRSPPEILYLMMQTSYGEHHWTPPKGHVDPGETEMITAIRETREESSLSPSDLKIYEDIKKVINYKVKGQPKIVTYWLAELINPKADVHLSDEHQNFKWLALEDACKLGKYPEMQETLRFFDEKLKNM